MNNTPNHQVLHKKLAALEGGQAALVTASGMAAISTTLMTLLAPGDHFLAQNTLYGGTHSLITQDLSALGITVDFIDGNDPDMWERKIQPETKLIYVETITNPLIQVADLKAVSRFAKNYGLVAIIDNTFASPVNFRPLEWGFHLSLHSGTKYLNGHTDIVAGAVIGDLQHIEMITQKLNHLGGSLDPHACFLLHRGIKTLALRVRAQNVNALKLSQFLESHPAVAKVNYPGLISHPQHQRAKELFDGFGGMLSFELDGNLHKTERFMRKLNLPITAPSLGGVETLITRPATTSHSGMPPEERRSLGISDTLVRLSVGLEAADDLIEDFEQALHGFS